MDLNNEQVMEVIFSTQQHIAADLSEMLMKYPQWTRPIALATLQLCVTSMMEPMSKTEKDIYEALLKKTVVARIPLPRMEG